MLAWARGCRCDECEREYQRLVSGLALRGPLRLPAQPEPRKLGRRDQAVAYTLTQTTQALSDLQSATQP